MRLICPHCMSGVTVPDDVAGKEVACPNCGKSFPTPARYSAAVVPEAPAPAPAPAPTPPPVPPVAPMPAAVPPTPPPGYAPPSQPLPSVESTGFLSAGLGSAEVPPPAGYTRSRGLTISPAALAWLPPLLLTLALILTFLPWVGSYAGHTSVYTQRPWGSIFSGVSRNFTLEKLIPIPPGWLDKVTSDWWLMLPYLVCLVVAVIVAWADRVYRAGGQPRGRSLQRVWPHREGVVAGLAALALLLSIVQVSRGFGMERAMRQVVNETFADERAKHANSPAELERVDYEAEQALAKFHLETTTWAWLALTLTALALFAAFFRWFLDRRQGRLPPRLVLYY